MSKEWVVPTQGDPLRTMRDLLGAIWDRAALEGMILPLRRPEGGDVRTLHAENRSQLSGFDPLAPVMPLNSAREIAEQMRSTPSAAWGAALRPCELRSLACLCKVQGVANPQFLRIGVDCLATFSPQDYERRARSAGGVERMSEESAQFARQGGIAAYRYRTACQICPSPSPGEADLTLGLIGLPVREYLLVLTQSEEVSARLGLKTLAAGPAPQAAIAQRRHALEALVARRERKCERVLSALPDGLPEEVAELVDHLRSCRPCRDCLDACPTCLQVLELGATNTAPLLRAAEQWVVLCSGCGMCDQACPRGYPLSAVIRRLARSLVPEGVAT